MSQITETLQPPGSSESNYVSTLRLTRLPRARNTVPDSFSSSRGTDPANDYRPSFHLRSSPSIDTDNQASLLVTRDEASVAASIRAFEKSMLLPSARDTFPRDISRAFNVDNATAVGLAIKTSRNQITILRDADTELTGSAKLYIEKRNALSPFAILPSNDINTTKKTTHAP